LTGAQCDQALSVGIGDFDDSLSMHGLTCEAMNHATGGDGEDDSPTQMSSGQAIKQTNLIRLLIDQISMVGFIFVPQALFQLQMLTLLGSLQGGRCLIFL
jgi:hypothetical protein